MSYSISCYPFISSSKYFATNPFFYISELLKFPIIYFVFSTSELAIWFDVNSPFKQFYRTPFKQETTKPAFFRNKTAKRSSLKLTLTQLIYLKVSSRVEMISREISFSLSLRNSRSSFLDLIGLSMKTFKN